MRCFMCDYNSDGNQSDFYMNLRRGGRRPTKVEYRPSLDKDVCDTCWASSFPNPEVYDPLETFHVLDEEWDTSDNIFDYVKRIEREDRYD